MPGGGARGRSPVHLAFHFVSAPHPPPLPRRGRGEIFSLFRRGLRPRHPCPEPLAAFIAPAKQVPNAEGSLRFGAKPIEPPFYEQCRQPRREGDRGRWTYPSLTRRRRLRWSSPPGQGEQVPPGASPGDARGEAPCIRKLKSPPSPEGKGGGGMGARKQAKGRVGGRPTGHAPPPRGHHSGRGYKCRRRFNAGVPGAKPPARGLLRHTVPITSYICR